MNHPTIIQGGMGIAVSDWRLARAVSRTGQLGVVSGTALDNVLARRLQDGDPGGHVRRALAHFPAPAVAERILARYFVEGGRAPEAPYRSVPMYTVRPSAAVLELTVAANFVEVWLAKEGHEGVVGINLLEKVQLPNLPSLYGAMLAGVDYVLMGAGIPREIPGALDRLALHEPASLKLAVEAEEKEDDFRVHFDPKAVLPGERAPLVRPHFLAIISSVTLAVALARRATGPVNGFVIEGPTAGGHNAPPRGALQLNERGEPVYGARDEVDLAQVRALGLPFWLAGTFAGPDRLRFALEQGAAGIQVGTAFALCRESGLAEEYRAALLRAAARGEADVFTDPSASPTGFPFKVARLPGSLSEPELYEARPRVCNMGYLRTPYRRADGGIGFRCPAEPVDQYVEKGGAVEDTVGRKCLCNGLMANIDLPQRQKNGYLEQPLVTTGDDLLTIARLLKPGREDYSAADVIDYLLAGN